MKRTLLVICAYLALFAAPVVVAPPRAGADTTVLYDGASGKLPSNAVWGWMLANFGGGAITAPGTTGAVTLNSTASNSIRLGYSRVAPVALDRTAGYTLRFDLLVVSENHSASDKNGDGLGDRAGISVIVVGNDGLGIELSFWGGEIWPQSQTPLFRHVATAERAFFNTKLPGTGAAGTVRYQLSVSGSVYALYANGSATPILTGPLRSYAAFSGFPDPYEIPNFLWIGDNTSSARGKFKLARVELTVP